MPRPRRRTHAERRALSEKRILRAATKLIARQGYTKTTLAQIGKEAGCAAGLVSHRFGSKEGLLRTLVEQIRSQFHRDRVEVELEGKSGFEALCVVVDAYLDVLRAREERLRVLYVLMGEALGPVAEIREVFAEADRDFRELVEKLLEAARRQRRIRSTIDSRAEAILFVGTLRGVAMQSLMSPEAFEIERVRDHLKDVLRARLTVPANGAALARRGPVRAAARSSGAR